MVCREMQVRRGKRQRGEAFSLFMWNLFTPGPRSSWSPSSVRVTGVRLALVFCKQ